MRPNPVRSPAPRPLAAALAAASLLTLATGPASAQPPAQTPALPSGLSVAAGRAQVSTSGNRMTVTNTPQAILNWNSFSIGAGNAVYFQQQNARSQVLNRVTGSDASQIMGSLGSNGRVWLLNPNGVLFGQSARVDVAGLVASTLRVNDLDWLAGRYRFDASAGGAAASVVNQGELRTSFGGTLALVGGSVGNDGLMLAPGGQAILAAGSSVELVDTGAANLSVRIAAPAGEARNLGVIDAAGGRIDITAAAVNQRGIVRADALGTGPGGEVWIKAAGALTLAPGSVTSAAGGSGTAAEGGSVWVQSDSGRTMVEGSVGATAAHGSGGSVVLLGREVGVLDGAAVDASGAFGGGSVVIGGGALGRDARYANADAIYAGPQSHITADAGQRGDGGDIVLWSDNATRAYGTLSARGGASGGNGGHIETSGGWLDAQPARVDTAAPAGAAGGWLLDPYNIFISDSTATSGNFGTGPTFVANAANSTIATTTIVSALASANVTISTGGVNGGNENGNITLSNATIVTNLGAARSLTLLADGIIDITSSTIRSDNGALTVNLLAAQTRNGGIAITGSSVTTGTGSTFGDLTLGGNKTGTLPGGASFGGAAGGAVPLAVLLDGATLNAGSGTLTMLGASTNGGGSGVVITDSSVTARTLVIAGDGPTGLGVEFNGSSTVRATQTATVSGRGGANGVWLHEDAQLSVLPASTDTSASLTIAGQSRTASGGFGVQIAPSGNRSYGVMTGRGASMTILGDSANGDVTAAVLITSPGSTSPAVDASGSDSGGGRSLTISTSGDARDIEINDAIVATGTGTTTIVASGDSRVAVLNNSSMSLLGPTSLSAQDVTVGNSTITAAVPLALNMVASRDMLIADSTISGSSVPVAVNLLAGSDSGGSLLVSTSQILSGGGAIAIGGNAVGTTPTGASFNGVGSNGSVFSFSTLDAGTGAITIAATAASSGGVAVDLDGSTLTGRSVTVIGDAPLGTGIVVDSGSTSTGTHDVTLLGRGFDSGVQVTPGSQVAVLPTALDTSAVGLVQGRGLDSSAGIGVDIAGSSGSPALRASNGASLTVEAASASPIDALAISGAGRSFGPVVDASTGGALTLRTFDNGVALSVTDAALAGGTGRATLQSGNAVTLSNSALSADGPVSVTGNRVALLASSLVQSQATGDAIVVSGPSLPLISFNNASGAGALASSNGRWIIYGTDINDSTNFVFGALPYDFKRHNANFGAWSADSGNGLVFDTPQTAVFAGTVQTKTYDGSATAVLSNAAITSISVPGDVGVLQPGTVRFLSVDAGANQAAAFDNPVPFTFQDSNSRPVFGYSLSGSLTGTITPRPISAPVTATKVYDATTAAVATIGAIGNLVGSETVLVSGSGSYDTKNVGSNKALTLSYAVLDGANGGKATNYSFAPTASPRGTITPRPLPLSGVSAVDKVYDATSNATIAGTPSVTPLAGDTVTVGGSPVANFADKNVGSAKPVTVSGGYSLGGTDGGNYTLALPAGLTASITPRPLVLGGVAAADKVYDAAVAATLTGSAAVAPLAGDAVGVAGSPTATFADKNVGSNKAVTVAGYTFTGTDAGNYTPQQPTGLRATINPRTVAVSGVTALDKVYDATTAATLAGGASVATLPGDAVTLTGSASGSFADKNVGSNKPVTLFGGYALAGADAGNYSLVQQLSTSASITPRPVSLVGVAVADKVYDATTVAALSGSASVTPLPGDSLSVGGTPTASFADKNAGVAKPVLVAGYALAGADAGNYTLGTTGGLTATITPRPAQIGGVSAAGKVYDATTLATLQGSATVTPLAGDTLSVTGTPSAAFADKNAGSNKAVAVAGYAFGGADAGNYAALQPTGLRADITPRPVTVAGIAADDKVYDASVAATLSGSASVAALPGDALVLGGTPTVAFADKNVGNDKAVTARGYTLGGADAANYSLSQPAGLVADITPLALSITGLRAADKVYDATTAATIAGSGSIAPLAGDAVTISGTPSASFADKNAGVAKPVLVAGYALGGADAGNYTVGQPAGLTATITPRPAAIGGVGVADKVYDATTAATLQGSATVAPLAGDALTVGGTPNASFADKNAGSNKAVAVAGYTLAGADAGNYTALQPTGLRAAITPLAVGVNGIGVADKVYDATTAAALAGSGSVAALAGDALALAGTPSASFADKRVGIDKPVAVAGYTLGGADAGNYVLTQPSGLVADITPRPLSISGLSVADKVYDATTAATIAGSGSANALPGDAVAISGTPNARFADKNAGAAKPVLVSGYALSGADAGNYTVGQPAGLTAAITPRPLPVTGVAANGKVYDGSAATTLSGSAAVAAIAGDSVALAGTGAAAFSDRNVGTAKPVAVSGYAIGGADAGNYALLPPQGLTASITPASLTYVADPAVRSVGQTITDLQGSVTGFVGGDALATATSGTLAFTTPAAAGSPVGTYPVQGTGLGAQNYVFTQAPSNAAALSIVDLTQNTSTVVDAVDSAQEVSASIATILSATRATAAETGIANLTVVVAAPSATVTPVADFKPVRLASLSAADLQSLLAGRDLFKRVLLADSVQKLQDNPKLADLRECVSVQDAQAGGCLITEQLKSQVQQQQPVAQAAAGAEQAPATPGPSAAATPGPSAAPAAPGAPGASATATPGTSASPPAPGTQAAPATPGTQVTPATAVPGTPGVPPATARPAPTILSTAPGSADMDPLLSEVLQLRRRVVNAALPQIERKIALVVGVNNYADKSIPALTNAVRDARSVAKVFETKLGYEAVVLDNATRATLVAALNRLALTVGPRDSVVIYYAGHGELVESTKLGYWLLSDSVANAPETWLSNTDISRLVGQMGASQVALISDSCYSGSLASEERIRAAPASLNPKDVLSRKSVVVMSSGGNEPVFDEGRDGHSPFAWNLMNTLGKVSDWQAGGNVFERVRFAVAREVPQRPQYSASRAAGHQTGGDYLFEQRQLDAGK